MTDHNPELGFFNYAHSYCQCGFDLMKRMPDATHSSQVIRHLFYHAIEMYLKSYLLAKGLAQTELSKRELGHRIGNLLDAAIDRGIQLPVSFHPELRHLQETDNVISSRYIRCGKHTVITLERLYEICFALHDEVIGEAYKSYSGSRRPILDGPS